MSLLLTLGLGVDAGSSAGGDTPYMNLLLPTVSVTIGPLYATEVNAAFLQVDSHDHSPGFGALVPSSGLNINADLTFNGHNLTNLNEATFNVQSPNPGVLTGAVYFNGQDFWVLDGTGVAIQVTAAGGVNVSGLGGWTGLTSPAQASYDSVTKTFALQSNTSGPKYGRLAVGNLRIFPMDPASGLPYIEIATPGSGVTSYTMQLPPTVAIAGKTQLVQMDSNGKLTLTPTPPTALSFLRMNTSGTVAADVTPDATLAISGSGPFTLGVANGGVGTAQLANNSVTRAKLAAAAPQVSTTFGGTISVGVSGSTTIGTLSFTTNGTGAATVQVAAAPTGGSPALPGNDATTSKNQIWLDGSLIVDNYLMGTPIYLTTLAAGGHSIQIRYVQTSDGTFNATYANIRLFGIEY